MPKGKDAAESVAQRKAAGMARAIQKGEMKAVPGTPSAKMAEMKPGQLKEFAHSKEKGLPEHKKSKMKQKQTNTGGFSKRNF